MADTSTAENEANGKSRGAVLVPFVAVAIAAAFLVAPLKKLGIWDPYELDAADLRGGLGPERYHAVAIGAWRPHAEVRGSAVQCGAQHLGFGGDAH